MFFRSGTQGRGVHLRGARPPGPLLQGAEQTLCGLRSGLRGIQDPVPSLPAATLGLPHRALRAVQRQTSAYTFLIFSFYCFFIRCKKSFPIPIHKIFSTVAKLII